MGLILGASSEHAPKTLRDEFASAALTGLCAYPDNVEEGNEPAHYARWAYALADAMMEARRSERASCEPNKNMVD